MAITDVHTPDAPEAMTATPSDGATRPWRDPRRPFWPLALVVPLLPFLAGGLVALTG